MLGTYVDFHRAICSPTWESNQRLLGHPCLEQLQCMFGLVKGDHVSRSVDADISQRAALPPQTTRPDLLVVLLLVSEIWETFPLQRPEDAFISDEVADLPRISTDSSVDGGTEPA